MMKCWISAANTCQKQTNNNNRESDNNCSWSNVIKLGLTLGQPMLAMISHSITVEIE